ncbi:hypothetical protein JCM11491_007066 [Sporobolomyces phaffii]
MPFETDSLQHAAPESRSRSSDPTPFDAAAAGDSASAQRRSPERHGRVVQPEVLKHPSLLANIRKTWTGTQDISNAHPIGQQQLGRASGAAQDGHLASVQGVAGDDVGVEVDLDDPATEGHIRPGVGSHHGVATLGVGDRVLCARWASLPSGGGATRRILMIAYKSGAFAVWDCSSLDSWFELVSLRSLETALDLNLSTRFSRGIGAVVDFAVAASTSIAIVTHRAKSSSSHVLLYSLESHQITSAYDIQGAAHRVAINRRFLVVSCTSPLALHVLSSQSLQPTRFSPITDLVPSPFDGAPVFCLGAGGRLLAYATSRPIPSSRLDRSPAKPGAGILAHSGLFDSESASPGSSTFEFSTRGGSPSSTLMSEAGQVGEQVARKVSEGVMSGVKAIGEAGMSYWLTRSTNTRNDGPATRDSTLSKSAPANTVAGFSRRLSVPGAFSRPSTPTTSHFFDSTHSAVAGTVLIVDLAKASPSSRQVRSPRASPSLSSSSLKTIAHFRPYHLPVSLLSFSPASTSILTASTASHSFDVFELHPSSPIGVSAFQSVPSASDSNSGKVWHRYRLQRGYTSARATSATWSDDGRFVAVGTGKGTAHVYAIQPNGGKPDFENHFDPKVKNLHELPPLSVSLSTIARVRPSASPASDEATVLSSTFPSLTFVARADSFASSFRPATSKSDPPSHGATGRSSSFAKPAPLQDLLVFDPATTVAQLHRLSVSETISSPSCAVAAASRGDVGKLATTAVSGLTQLMKSRGGLGGFGTSAGAPGAAPTLTGGEQTREWVATCSAKAEWRLARDPQDDDVAEESIVETDKLAHGGFAGIRYSAYAEIETFSRSPRVLPRSVYESQQFTFFALPADYSTLAAQGTYHFPQSRRLETRSQVVVRQGQSAVSVDATSRPHDADLFEPASFDQPIRTAMQTVLDHEAMLAPGSPRLPAPSFPVGVAAKQGSWRDSIPIRAVGPAAIEGIERVRQGLGRVKLPNAGELVDAARRRRSSVAATLIGSSGHAAYSSSISFDDDEAVFADRLSIEAKGSTSTACTSEAEGAALVKGQLRHRDEVDEWGWDEPDEPVDSPMKPSPVPSPVDDAMSQPLFDDDFDNFELELSGPPAPPIEPLSPPPAIAVELSPGTASPSSRNLAPPVSLPDSTDEPSPLSASPRPVNPLLEVLKPSTTTPLSSSPSSLSSNTSSSGGGGKKKKRK